MGKDSEDKIVKVNPFEVMTARLLADMPESTGEVEEAVEPAGAQLPLWREDVFGAPNSLLRGGLFAPIRADQRRAIAKPELVAVGHGIEVSFSGEQLNQDDLDVWNVVVQMARHRELGSRFEFRGYALLKRLGKGTGPQQYEWLEAILRRLRRGLVDVFDAQEGLEYHETLLAEWVHSRATKVHMVRLSPLLEQLYNAGWSELPENERLLLKSKQLAKWLQTQLATHAKPYPMKVETYQRESGVQTSQLWKFRQSLKKALADLQSVGGIESWHIDDQDLVHVRRRPSPSQQRHLKRSHGSTRKLPRPE